MKSLIHDGLTFTSKLTGRRIKNILKTYRGFKKAQQTKSPVHGGFLFSISVEPTTSCNLRCPECRASLKKRRARKVDDCEMVCGSCGRTFDVCDLETVEELKKQP